MNSANNTLLPSGLMDVLPPLAAAEFDLIGHFLRSFQGFGYQPVIPPLAEYAETLLAGQGAATEHHVLRMTDPLNTRQLALRADITGQVARIAGGTLGTAPRPLRLCYAGYTLRAAPEALETRRQHTQVGIERFGDMSTPAIAEVLAISVHALTRVGVADLTLDLTYPAAMGALLAEFPEAARAAIHDAVRLKDSAQLRSLGATVMADVLDASGAAASVLPRLAAIAHPVVAKAVTELSALTTALAAQQVPARLSIDMLDLAGYGYYSGIGYALYWNAAQLEVGRGGCYRTAAGEDAAGFTLYINDLLDQLGSRDARPLKSIPYGTPAATAARLQAEGFVTVYGE
jgi:ATP phosphoribosyltransferase regulatory subunit